MVRTAALAVGLMVASGAQAAVSLPDLTSWAAFFVKAEGWTSIAMGSGTVVYARPFPGASSPKRLWVRFENHPTADDPAKSAMTLYEFECSAGRSRVLQSVNYPENNLAGSSWQGRPTAWSYPAPSTLGEAIFKTACAQ